MGQPTDKSVTIGNGIYYSTSSYVALNTPKSIGNFTIFNSGALNMTVVGGTNVVLSPKVVIPSKKAAYFSWLSEKSVIQLSFI